jgi:hypothetical protein
MAEVAAAAGGGGVAGYSACYSTTATGEVSGWIVTRKTRHTDQIRSFTACTRQRCHSSRTTAMMGQKAEKYVRDLITFRCCKCPCKIWGFHGGDYEECRLLWYRNQVRTSQETHYVSATDPSHLMLCKIWGFQGGDYEEWHLLRYRNPVRTSQETHYFSNTELSQLMLYNIWVFHGGDYEECRLLGCYAVWLL